MLSYLKRYYQYTKERFPLWQFFLLSALFSFTAGSITQRLINQKIDFLNIFVAFLAIFLFLFRLRLFDEFKDASHDALHYKDRPVPRGLIKLAELKPLIFLVIVCEIAVSLKFYPFSTIIFIITFVYSLVLFKEFFIANWLRKKFTLYIFLHELIAIPIFYYLLVLNGLELTTISLSTVLIIVLFLTLELFLLEVTRKIRAPKEENDSKDTYTSQYGISGATGLILAISVSILLGYFFLFRYFQISIWFEFLPIISLLAIIFNLLKFRGTQKEIFAKQTFISSIVFVFTTNLVLIFSLICYS